MGIGEMVARRLWGRGIKAIEARAVHLQDKLAQLQGEQGETRELVDALLNETGAWRSAIAMRPWRFTEDMVSVLGEYDPELADWFYTLRGYEGVGILGIGRPNPTEADRRVAVDEARFLFTYSVLAHHAINLWTNFGFGQRVEIASRDPNMIPVWEEFWNARRNQPVLKDRNLHVLSNKVLTDGELAFIFFVSTIDGSCTVRRVPTEEIVEIITHPQDRDTPLYYKRQFVEGRTSKQITLYYKDWQAAESDLESARGLLPPNAVMADAEANPQTEVVMMLCSHNTISGRGWPITVAAAPWDREHKRFRENRAAVSRLVATYVDKLTVKGGERAVDMIRARLTSGIGTPSGPYNDPPVAGSTWLQNEMLNRERMPLATGAGDAKADGESLAWMALLGFGIFPHYGGIGDAYRLATATAMETPILEQWKRYRLWWASVWQDFHVLVATMHERYTGETFDTHAADVSSGSILQPDLTQISNLIGVVLSAIEKGTLGIETSDRIMAALLMTALQSLNISDVDQIISMPPPDRAGPPPDTAAATGQVGESGYDDMGAGLRAAVRGLWRGDMNRFDFINSMIATITRNLTRAWHEGLESVGLTAADMTDAEQYALSVRLGEEFSHLSALADDIESARVGGEQLGPLLARAAMWQNRYNDVRNQARTMAASDPKLEWVLGPTEEHCNDCSGYAGRVHRASIWDRVGARPQSQALGCHGFNCQCELAPTDNPALPGLPPAPKGA